ncbi:hypothetical protein B0A48_03990 [Cryoendolithus antarcticus]|uniref:Paf1-domain-containing protein n=1 Tax=Cryoendolithus antarcticus TaxID=1507870 RepID=A0A1V8TH59_9PEZI|nr:hypothetical protein B0A48_03990 [Cryoendolithus antarcticus]
MSSQRPERSVHQDYIARIRYSNQLPPPPLPPKLLDIPGTGLAGGQYTSAGYASRLAREQPLNIEADAELGMPIDLVGIPGVFDGDESAIMIRPGPRHIHPRDKPLLRPLASLSKSASATDQVSFLRRTEYAASSSPQMFATGSSKDILNRRSDHKPKTNGTSSKSNTTLEKDDPLNIIRHIVKGFDLAYPEDVVQGEQTEHNILGAPSTSAEQDAWSNPTHPTKPSLELLDSYPLLPDLSAIPPSGWHMLFKFRANPLGSTRYDTRLDTAILRPVANEAQDAAYAEREEAWEEGKRGEKPMKEFDYEYFIPSSEDHVRSLKRIFSTTDPDHDDPSLYPDETTQSFPFDRLRMYETKHQAGSLDEFYNDVIGLALHDPSLDIGKGDGRLQKGAYVYPVAQRVTLQPKRHAERGEIARLDVRVSGAEEAGEEEWRERLDPGGVEGVGVGA